MKTYANVGWTPGDVQTLAPQWTEEECLAFLEENAKHIQNALVQYGWEVMELLIPPEAKAGEDQPTKPESES